jgi:hypothetical protein
LATRASGNRQPRRRAEPKPQATTSGRDWAIFMILSIYLIGTFVYRAATPAHEYAMTDELWLTMGLDTAAAVGLVAMRLKLAKERVLPMGETILFWVALAAGFGLFLIRTTSDAAWWTGHLVYYLEPR